MNIEKLNPIQGQIVNELCRAVASLGAGSGLLCILGSWGDTLPEADILKMLKEYNALSAQPQHQHDQHTSVASSGQ